MIQNIEAATANFASSKHATAPRKNWAKAVGKTLPYDDRGAPRLFQNGISQQKKIISPRKKALGVLSGVKMKVFQTLRGKGYTQSNRPLK